MQCPHMSVQAISTMLPFTPGGAGAQQALLVATLASGHSRSAVLSYSVGQQIAIAAWAALLGFLALIGVFRTTDVRGLMREWAPKADEKISYGMLTWSGQLIFAWLIPTTKDITFSFMQGAYFEDKYGLLRGTGKHARHVKLKTLDDINKTTLRYYVRQALKHDKRPVEQTEA